MSQNLSDSILQFSEENENYFKEKIEPIITNDQDFNENMDNQKQKIGKKNQWQSLTESQTSQKLKQIFKQEQKFSHFQEFNADNNNFYRSVGFYFIIFVLQNKNQQQYNKFIQIIRDEVENKLHFNLNKTCSLATLPEKYKILLQDEKINFNLIFLTTFKYLVKLNSNDLEDKFRQLINNSDEIDISLILYVRQKTIKGLQDYKFHKNIKDCCTNHVQTLQNIQNFSKQMDPFQTKITFSGLKISCSLMGIFGESKNTLDFKSKDVSGQEILDFTLILFQPEKYLITFKYNQEQRSQQMPQIQINDDKQKQKIQQQNNQNDQEEKQKKDNLLKSKKERAERRQKSKQELDVQHQIGVENIIESGIASLNNSLSHQDSAAVIENSKDFDADNNLQQQQLIKNNSTSILNDSLNQNFSQNLQIPQHKRTTSSNNNYPKKQLSQQNQSEEINKIEKEKQDWKDKFLASEKKNVQIQTQLNKLQEVFQKQVNENSQLKKNIHELNQEKKNWKINETELKIENDTKKQQDLNSQNDEKQKLLNQIQVLEQKFNENQKTIEAKNASINNYKEEIRSVKLQVEELKEQIKLLKNENEKIKTEKEDEISNITEIFNSQNAKSNDQRKQYQDLENQVKEQLQQIKENKNQEIKQLQAQLDNIDEIQAKKQEQKTVLLRERIQQLSLDIESLKKQNQKDIELIKNQQQLDIQKIKEQKLVLESQIDYLKKFVLNKYHLNEEKLNQEIDEYVKFDQQGDSSIARELITRGNQENNLSSSQIEYKEINQKNSNLGIKTRPNKKFNKYNTILKNQHNLKQQENQINDKLQQQNFQNMIKANIYQLNPQETEQESNLRICKQIFTSINRIIKQWKIEPLVAFNIIDYDQDQKISSKDLKYFFRELKKENHAGDQKYFKYEYTEIIIKFLDLDKDGYLNYQEFLKALKI